MGLHLPLHLDLVRRETFTTLVPWHCHVSVSTRRSRMASLLHNLRFLHIKYSEGDTSPGARRTASVKCKKIVPSAKAENAAIKK